MSRGSISGARHGSWGQPLTPLIRTLPACAKKRSDKTTRARNGPMQSDRFSLLSCETNSFTRGTCVPRQAFRSLYSRQGLAGRSRLLPPHQIRQATPPATTIPSMIQSSRLPSCIPDTVSADGRASVASDVVLAGGPFAAARLGLTINASEAAAVINPFRRTNFPLFVLIIVREWSRLREMSSIDWFKMA